MSDPRKLLTNALIRIETPRASARQPAITVACAIRDSHAAFATVADKRA